MHLLASGSNGSGQLALSHVSDAHTFTETQFHPSVQHLLPGANILDLVSASTHALLLVRTAQAVGQPARNILLGAGTNTLGQLGPKCALWETSRAETRWKPVDLLSGTGVGGHEEWEAVKIAATWTTSFVVYHRTSLTARAGGLMTNGDDSTTVNEILVSCGSNDFGELGRSGDQRIPTQGVDPSDNPTLVDLRLAPGERIEMIRGGQRHVLTVISDGAGQRVMGWGANRKGELDLAALDGIGLGQTRDLPMSSRKGKGKAATRPATLQPTLVPLNVPPGARILDVRLGASHSLALISDGSILAWGSDAKGQIGGLCTIMQAAAVGATWGGSYVLRQTAEGSLELLSQGSNTYSQLLRPIPTLPPESASACAGPVRLPEGCEVHGFAAGSEHLLVHIRQGANQDNGEQISEDELWVGGWNEHGNLGLGHTVDSAKLVPIKLARIEDAAGATALDADRHQRSVIRIRGMWGGCAASWIWIDSP